MMVLIGVPRRGTQKPLNAYNVLLLLRLRLRLRQLPQDHPSARGLVPSGPRIAKHLRFPEESGQQHAPRSEGGLEQLKCRVALHALRVACNTQCVQVYLRRS